MTKIEKVYTGEGITLAEAELEGDRYAVVSTETALSTLKPEERLILRLRYIEGMSWTQVCLRAHYSRTQVFRIHAAALKRIA